MARSITDIKKSLTDVFISNGVIIQAYGLDTSKTFEDQFSTASVESILFYIVAYGIWVIESLFDLHKKEVNEIIQNILPHRPKWYRDKALNFMKDNMLIPDTDIYDITGMSDEDIRNSRVVKYAAAVEEKGSSVLVVKIATEADGDLKPLDTDTETQFTTYMQEIKDAGVVLSIVNQEGDNFACELDIYYSSMLLESDVKQNSLAAIKGYLTGLPFNSEYSNMSLVDAIQVVTGVQVVEFKSSMTNGNIINGTTIPVSGYFKYEESFVKLNMIPHVVAE